MNIFAEHCDGCVQLLLIMWF